MKKALKRDGFQLYHYQEDKKATGKNPDMEGDCSRLRGDCTGLEGDCTGLEGDCSDLWGDFDECEISHSERCGGLHISVLEG